MIKIRLWYCDICDKTITFRSKSKHIKSKSHKRKKKFGVFVKEAEFNRPDINMIDYIINNCARECYNKYFHTFKFRCIYDIELKNSDLVKGIISVNKFKNVFEKMVLYIY